MKKEIARYILALNEAVKDTHRADDRPIYVRYLAGAGVLLALAETEASLDILSKAIAKHERLWGQTWLIDGVFKRPLLIWQQVKECIK